MLPEMCQHVQDKVLKQLCKLLRSPPALSQVQVYHHWQAGCKLTACPFSAMSLTSSWIIARILKWCE